MSIPTKISVAAAPKIQEPDRGSWTSASNAQADELCPGRHLAQKGLPDESTEDSEFGTAMHKALATQNPDGLTPEQESIYESTMEIESKLLTAYFGNEVSALRPNPQREKRYWVHWPDGLRHSGQIDCAHRRATKGLIIEYKSLPGQIPSSPRNKQLRDQAVLFAANTALLSEVAVAVIQPLVTHKTEITVYTKEDLGRAANELYERVVKSNTPESPRVAGEIQCKFCKAKTACAQYQKWAASLLPATQSLVDVPIAQWTPQQRSKFCEVFDTAQAWLNEAWKQMEKGAASDPEFVPGYNLVDGTPRRTINNLQSVFDRYSAAGGDLKSFMENATITNTDLTAITKSATKLKGKKLEDKVDEIIGLDFTLSKPKKQLKKITS